MADDSDYARRITSLRQQSLADLAGARADPVALRTALARFFRRGTQLGFSDAESVDFLGVTSPSILELAGFSDDAEQHAMSLVSQLTDLDIHQAWPTRSLLLLAPRRGRSELKVDSGASPRWCALDYSAETDSFGSLFSVQPAPEADRDTLRWLPDVAGGANDAAFDCAKTRGLGPRFTLTIARVHTHPRDTNATICRANAAALFRELASYASTSPRD